jgi:hypothetical protein
MSKAMPDDEMVSWLLFYTGYSIRFISEFVGSGFQHIAFSCTNIFAAIADMRARGQKNGHAGDPGYFAWGCFRYFGWEQGGLPSRSSRTRGPPSPLASARQPSLASRAKAGGPGRTRICNQTVMSGGNPQHSH